MACQYLRFPKCDHHRRPRHHRNRPMATDRAAATPDDRAERQKLYDASTAEIHKREVSSSENFDKSILTFSSAGLALSIGFLRDFVPIQAATAAWTLYGSWTLFTFATCSTMISFLASSRALAFQKELAHRYYIDSDESASDSANPWDKWTQYLNLVSGAAFMLAMVLSVIFISVNLAQGSSMTQKDNQSKPDLIQKGLPVPTMQKVPQPPAQPAVSQPTPAQAPASTPSNQ